MYVHASVRITPHIHTKVRLAKTSIYLGLQRRQAALRSPGQELSARGQPPPWNHGSGVTLGIVCLTLNIRWGLFNPVLCAYSPRDLLALSTTLILQIQINLFVMKVTSVGLEVSRCNGRAILISTVLYTL